MDRISRRMKRGLITCILVTSLVNHVLSTSSSPALVETAYTSSLHAGTTFASTDVETTSATTESDVTQGDLASPSMSVSDDGNTTPGTKDVTTTVITTTDLTTTEACAVPGHVTSTRVLSEPTSLNVKWNKSSDSPVCVTHYQVCWANECRNTTDIELAIKDLVACTEYSVSITTFGEKGKSPTVTIPTSTKTSVPGTVKNLHATPESFSVNVNWARPADNAACVKNYTVCWEANDCRNTTDTNMTIDNLSACTEYNISVVADGASDKSIPVSSLVRTLAAAPLHVTHLKLTAESSSSVKVEWLKPSDDTTTACIKHYSVCLENNCSVSTNTEMTFNNLSACKNYRVSVQVIGEEEKKSPSVTDQTTTRAAVPGNITNVEMIDRTTSSLEIKWDEPTENPACILNYAVCWRAIDIPENQSQCSTSSVTNYTINGLQSCSYYDISVTAVESKGSSPTIHHNFATENTAPGSISNLIMINSTTSSLQLQWDTPSENAECIVHYQVCWLDVNFENGTRCFSTENTTVTIEDLEACSSYNVSIIATGINGSSAAVYGEFKTNNAVPENISNVLMNNHSTFWIQLKWDKPSVNPTCVSNYSVYWEDTSTSEGNFSASEDSNYTIYSLKPCSTYNVSIKANAIEGSSTLIHSLFSTEDAVPGNILNLFMNSSSTSSLELTWDEPIVNPTCVSNYSVHWEDTSGKEENSSLSEVNNYIIYSLEPCSTYNVSIKANGIKGASSLIYHLFSTDNDVPGSVLNLDVQSSFTLLQATWTKPSVNTACAANYVVCWSASRGHNGHSNNYDCYMTGQEQVNISDLLPCTEYHVFVAAAGPSQSSENVTVTAATLSLVPDKIPNVTLEYPSPSSLAFKWNEPSEYPTCVHNYSVCWEDVGGLERKKLCSDSEVTRYTIQNLLPCTSYNVSIIAQGSEGRSSPIYNVSETLEAVPSPPQNLSCLKVGVQNATVGWLAPMHHPQCVKQYNLSWTVADKYNDSSTNHTNYTINYLQPKTTYNVTIAAVTKGKLTSQWIFITIVTDSEPENTSIVIAASVVSVLLMCGIVISTLYMYRKGHLTWPPWKKYGVRRKSLTHREIPIKDFCSYSAQLLSTPARLQSEYQLLITLCSDYATTMSSTVGHLPDNKKKNRYVNVIPYDATRVKLETNNKGTSDYINASFIKGYTGSVEYIATQGPKEDTCEDFWNMVLQQNVQLILMLTQFEENDKVKCFRYFPGLRGNVKFGSITVHCATEMMFPIYTQRTFTIYKDGRKKTVKHLHFREWPDFGCPNSTDVMLEFVQVGRQNTESREYPTVIHCSAGVGRTGTYIAVDILIQHIRENKKVDIFNTVYKLRQHRVNMVQSEAQYIYIYQCIKDALEDESIMNADKSSSNHSLEPIYENIGLTVNKSSYEKLAKESKKVKKNSKSNSHM